MVSRKTVALLSFFCICLSIEVEKLVPICPEGCNEGFENKALERDEREREKRKVVGVEVIVVVVVKTVRWDDDC